MKTSFYILVTLLVFTSLSSGQETAPGEYGKWKRYAASIAGKYDGTLNFNELMQLALSNKIDPPKPLKGCSLTIKSFTFLYFNPKKSQPVYREIVNGNRFTGSMQSKFMQAMPGDYFIFESIVGKCSKNRKMVKLPPLIFDYNGIKTRAQ